MNAAPSPDAQAVPRPKQAPTPPKPAQAATAPQPQTQARAPAVQPRQSELPTPLQKRGDEGESIGITVLGRVRTNWLRPVGSSLSFHCRLRIDYLAGGFIANVAVLDGCGNNPLDDSVERAIWKTQPLAARSGPERPRQHGAGVHSVSFSSRVTYTLRDLWSCAAGGLLLPCRHCLQRRCGRRQRATTRSGITLRSPGRAHIIDGGNRAQGLRRYAATDRHSRRQLQYGDVLGNGYDYERPVHTVRVEGFLIGRYEVSVAEWMACVQAGACPGASAAQDPTPSHPVSMVSWDEAQQYVAWLTRRTGRAYRLPSEAEWEYAARAGSENQYTWGNTETSICQHANVLDISGHQANPAWTWSIGCDDGFARAAPVGSFPPN